LRPVLTKLLYRERKQLLCGMKRKKNVQKGAEKNSRVFPYEWGGI